MSAAAARLVGDHFTILPAGSYKGVGVRGVTGRNRFGGVLGEGEDEECVLGGKISFAEAQREQIDVPDVAALLQTFTTRVYFPCVPSEYRILSWTVEYLSRF